MITSVVLHNCTKWKILFPSESDCYPKEEILFITCVAGFVLGIFKECHKVVPPEPFFESCVFDMCATGGEVVALCQAIESYADMCAANGVPIDWRDSKFCRKSVNKYMIFVDGLISLQPAFYYHLSLFCIIFFL